METIISLIAMMAVGYGAFRGMKWMSKAGQINARKELPLTPTDLKVLEEAAARLMTDLRATTDDCVARINKACEDAEARIIRLEAMRGATAPAVSPTEAGEGNVPAESSAAVLVALDAQLSPAEIARQMGATTGEIGLMRGLRAIAN